MRSTAITLMLPHPERLCTPQDLQEHPSITAGAKSASETEAQPLFMKERGLIKTGVSDYLSGIQW